MRKTQLCLLCKTALPKGPYLVSPVLPIYAALQKQTRRWTIEVGETKEPRMSTVSTNAPTQMGRLGYAIAKFRNKLATNKLQREAYIALSALSDRELADIGIYRGDIKRVCSEMGYEGL